MYDKAESFHHNPSTYKLFMADMSQVYCGRSLSPNTDPDTVDDRRLTSLLETAVSYRPIRKNTAKNNRRANSIAKEANGEDDERADAALYRSVGSDNSTEGSSSSRRSSSASPADKSTLSGGGSSSGGTGGGGATLRRKCQPLHKCATVNQSVSSIMRPSRYSMTSFTSEVVNDNSVHSQPSSSNRRFSRRRSSNEGGGLPVQSMHSYFLQRESLGNSQRSLSSLDDPWVASGVDFSSSVEVYVFRK